MSLFRFQVPVRALFRRPILAAQCIAARNKDVKSRHFASSAADVDHKLYEYRVYSIKPDQLAAFVKLTNEQIHMRLSHSKLIGYWMSDLGGMNEVCHIWEYDNFAQRTAVRAALGADKVWQQKYFQHILKMMTKQENAVLKAIPSIPLQTEPRKEGGIYELRQYTMKPVGPGVFLPPFLELLESRVKLHEQLNYGKLMGAWVTDIGNVNNVYHLWNYESLDKRTEGRHVVLGSDELKNMPITSMPVVTMTTKIMLPLPFSPLK
ncbi:protein NipSnap homolog 3A-like [Amphiura filiformis]|uniref:protein NipSnap homolog 3A-like n=1 Tax=Amphiura filiformis TaxID=82378 RepID=UPI003B21B842